MAKRLYQNILSFWQDERGQSTTEYILILSVVVMIALKFKQKFTDELTQMLGKLGNNLDSAMQDTSSP